MLRPNKIHQCIQVFNDEDSYSARPLYRSNLRHCTPITHNDKILENWRWQLLFSPQFILIFQFWYCSWVEKVIYLLQKSRNKWRFLQRKTAFAFPLKTLVKRRSDFMCKRDIFSLFYINEKLWNFDAKPFLWV